MPQYVPGFEPATPSAYAPGFEPVVPDDAGGGIINAANAALKSARDWFQPAANNLVRAPYEIATGQRPLFTGVETPAEYQTPPSSAGGQLAAELINPVPGNLTSAGSMAGTVAAGPFGPIARILSAALGAGAGSAVSGNEVGDVVRDVGAAGLGAGAAEGLAAAGSKLLRSVPNNPIIGGKRNIAEADAARYGAEMGAQSPPLAGAGSAQDLRTLAAGAGRDRLSAAKEDLITRVEKLLQTPRAMREYETPPVESLPGSRPGSEAFWATRPFTGPSPVGTAPRPTDPSLIGPRGVPLNVPALGERPLSLREANDALSDIGARAFSKNPLDRTFNGIDQRRLYGQVARDIATALEQVNPEAAQLFAAGQEAYKRGITLLKPLERSSAWRTDPSGLQFNTPDIQRMLASPKGEAALRNKLGDEGFESLRSAMLRGGAPGEVDRLAGGAGGMFDALLGLLRQGGGFGTTAALPFRTGLPNLGSGYAGTAPYTPPTGLQMLMDLIGIQAATRGVATNGK